MAVLTSPAAAPVPRLLRTRRVALRVIYTLLSLYALVMASFGPIQVLSGRVAGDLHYLAITASVFKILTLGAALGVLATAGRGVAPVRVLVVGQMVWAAADLIAPDDDASIPVRLSQALTWFVMWIGPWLLLSTDRTRLWRDPWPIRSRLAVLATAPAAALLVWAWQLHGLGTASAMAQELRFDQAGFRLALAGALVLVAVLGSLLWAWVTIASFAVGGLSAIVFASGQLSPGISDGLLLLAVAAALIPLSASRAMDARGA